MYFEVHRGISVLSTRLTANPRAEEGTETYRAALTHTELQCLVSMGKQD